MSSSSATGPTVSFWTVVLASSASWTRNVYSRSLMWTSSTWPCVDLRHELAERDRLLALAGLRNCQIARNITISRTQSRSVLCDCFTKSPRIAHDHPSIIG